MIIVPQTWKVAVFANDKQCSLNGQCEKCCFMIREDIDYSVITEGIQVVPDQPAFTFDCPYCHYTLTIDRIELYGDITKSD